MTEVKLREGGTAGDDRQLNAVKHVAPVETEGTLSTSDRCKL